MVRPLVPLVGIVLLFGALAGCIAGDEEKPTEIPVPTESCAAEGVCGAAAIVDETGRDLRTHLLATDTLDAPTWQVGDVFEQHLFYGTRDTAGEHIVTMVVDDAGSCYQFGTTSKVAASTDAVYDLPILGCVDKANLETSAFGVAWDWMYQFPLKDGKTWTGSVEEIFNWNTNTFHDFKFTLTATYNEYIDTPRGNFPGFEILGTTDDGQLLLKYNYVPAVGWFSHFWMYDIATAEPDDIMFHAMSMGTWKGFTGTYYIDESDTVVEAFSLVPFSLMEGAAPQATFTVGEDVTYLKGVIVPIACPGSSTVAVIDPANAQTTYEHAYEGDAQACMEEGDGNPMPGSYSVNWYDEPAAPGEWKFAAAGYGIFGYFFWLEGVKEVAYELAAQPAAATE